MKSKPVMDTGEVRQPPATRCRVGAPRCLGALPLLGGLVGKEAQGVDLLSAPPSAMLDKLVGGYVQAALLPSIDLQAGHDLVVLPAGCVAAAGRTLAARIFTRVRPEQIQTLWADMDSRSAVALAKVLWGVQYNRELRIIPFDPLRQDPPDDAEAALLVGDKVVSRPPMKFDRHLDPAAMWYEMTGLPFVFAVWAALPEAPCGRLLELLRAGRITGPGNLERLARANAVVHGWPADLAIQHLARHMRYDLRDEQREGLDEFFALAQEARVLDQPRPVRYHEPGASP